MQFLRLGLRARFLPGSPCSSHWVWGIAGFGMLGLSDVTQTIGKMEALSGNLVRVGPGCQGTR